MTPPLVSCLMPTADRRAFVPHAIRRFLAQDYPHCELLVCDDGATPVEDLIPRDERIRYTRLGSPLSIGAKRNVMCEQARGEIIAHWDDDDWSASHRVSTQVSALQAGDAAVCGLSRLWFYEPQAGRAWQYVYPDGAPAWVAGGTLCYRRSLWQRHPFSDVSVGEDTRFVWSFDDPCVPLADTNLYVATIHGRNTSTRQTDDDRFVAMPVAAVERVLGADAAALASACESVTGHQPCEVSTMQLNLGCCDALLPDYVNVDLVEGPGIQQADLRQRWPWPDGSARHVRAWDIVEHLPDKIFTMNELWRVLCDGGTAEIAVPTTDGTGAFQDPTHVSFWNRRSFLYYEAGNPYRERFARSYGIAARFRIEDAREDVSADGPRLTIVLRAVKS